MEKNEEQKELSLQIEGSQWNLYLDRILWTSGILSIQGRY